MGVSETRVYLIWGPYSTGNPSIFIWGSILGVRTFRKLPNYNKGTPFCWEVAIIHFEGNLELQKGQMGTP